MNTLQLPAKRKPTRSLIKANTRDFPTNINTWYTLQQSWDQLDGEDQADILSAFRNPNEFDSISLKAGDRLL